MDLPKIPSVTTQSVFNAVFYAVLVGGVFLAAKKGASMIGGPVQTVVDKAADLAGQ